MLLRDKETGNLTPRASRDRAGNRAPALRLSRTVVAHACERKEAVLSRDAARDAAFADSHSLADFQIRSVMCVPLIGADDEVFGAVQLHSSHAGAVFDERCLDLFSTVICSAAMALENARLHAQVLARRR